MLSMPPPSRIYSYTKITDLKPNQKRINVFGVVKTFEAPKKSRSRDYCCSLQIVDQSEKSVKCILFNVHTSLLPGNCSIGDIICIRRIDVSVFNGHLQLLASHFSSWLLFRRESSNIVPVTCTSSFTFTEEEKRCVQQLRNWASSTSLVPSVVSNPNTGPITRSTQSRTRQQSNHSPPVSPTDVESPSVKCLTTLHMEPAGPSTSTKGPGPLTSTKGPGPSTSISATDSPFTSSKAPQNSRVLLYSDSNSQPLSKRHYQCRIVDIGKLTSGECKVGVCGIIKYFKPSSRSKGLDFFVTVALIDMSSPSKSLSCTLFNPSEQKLPKVHSVGDIVIAKGLKTGSYQGLLQARGHEHTLVGVVDGDTNSPIPEWLGDWYKLSMVERSSLHSLNKWMHAQGPLLLNTKLGETSIGNYFNTVCRVAAISVFEPLHLSVLSVFDGTSPSFSCRSLHLSTSKYTWESHRDPCLLYTYQGFIYDVYVIGLEYFEVAVGDFVSMVNVRAKSLSDTHANSSTSPVDVEFILDGKGLHRGVVNILPADGKTVTDWIAHLPVPFGPLPVCVDQGDSPNHYECQIINEGNIRTAVIEEVCQSPIGSKFVVEVQIENVRPGPVEEMCQLRCSKCKTKYCILTPSRPVVKVESRPQTVGDDCIYCSDADNSGPQLQFMYVFKLCLRDQTGCLDIFVSEQDAENFLSIGPPMNMYTNREARENLIDVLYLMTGGNDPFYPAIQRSEFSYKRPLLKLCVRSYTAVNGDICFQLVDTTLNAIRR